MVGGITATILFKERNAHTCQRICSLREPILRDMSLKLKTLSRNEQVK